MKKKTETTTKSVQSPVNTDYSAVLPLLSVSLRQPLDTLVAYVIAPMVGHGLVYAAVYGENDPVVGILDVALDAAGQLIPGAFGVVTASGIVTYSQILGFFERFASTEVSREEVAQLFETV
jgi:hypothetical protein